MNKKNTNLHSMPINDWIVTATSFLTNFSSEGIDILLVLVLANLLRTGMAVIGLIMSLVTVMFYKYIRKLWVSQSPYPLRRRSRQSHPGMMV